MLRRSAVPRDRERWVYCLTAVAEVIDQLPALFEVFERGEDDVRIELHMKAGAWEVLRFAAEGSADVAGSLSSHLDNPESAPFPSWLTDAVSALAADLHWAASRDCAEQGSEVLSALVTFRASMLRGAVY